VNLLVRLHMVECLEYRLDKLILSGYELLHLRFLFVLLVWLLLARPLH
jgi:hypothetical protein